MKKTFEFRYHQDKFGDWFIARKYLFFGFVPVWMWYREFSRYDFLPGENKEESVLKFISNTIAHEQKLDSHKNTYRFVNEHSF